MGRLGYSISLAWWGKIYGNQKDLADIFFTTEYVNFTNSNGDMTTLPGLGFNIVRYNAGASSYNNITLDSGEVIQMIPSENIISSRQIDGYWLDPVLDVWDFTVDQNQRNMLQLAIERIPADTLLTELFSNSPMWWQLSNYNPSGSSDGSDNLNASEYYNHARYLSTLYNYAMNHWNVTFNYVERTRFSLVEEH